MIRIVYVSAAVRLFTQEELDALLLAARANNQCLNVTGMLVYADGNFMQALEGPREAVLGLEATIGRDPRHRGMQRMTLETVETRLFGQWSMGYRRVESKEAVMLAGFTDFLDHRSAATASPGRASVVGTLLESFRNTM